MRSLATCSDLKAKAVDPLDRICREGRTFRVTDSSNYVNTVAAKKLSSCLSVAFVKLPRDVRITRGSRKRR